MFETCQQHIEHDRVFLRLDTALIGGQNGKVTQPQLRDLLELYDKQERIALAWPPYTREVAGRIVRHVPPVGPTGAPAECFITYGDFRTDAESADAAIDAQIAYAAARKLTLIWKLFGHDLPEDLAARLLDRGFVAEEIESIMVLDLDRPPAALTDPSVARGPDAIEVRRIEDPRKLADAQSVTQRVWGQTKEQVFAELSATLRERPESLAVYVAYSRDTPVSAAWLRLRHDSEFASLWGGSTLAAYRGRGLYTALVAARAQDAIAFGARYLTIDAGPMSRPIVEKHGFQQIATACDHIWTGTE